MNDLFISMAIFVIVITILVVLRLKVIKNFEIKQADIWVALIPVALWLLLSGRIQKFEFGDLSIQTAFVEATETPIIKQITPIKQLPVESVRIDSKRGIEEIPRLIRNKTEALYFELGYGRYYGPAIESYLKDLSEFPFFKYIIISDKTGKFVGMADAKELNLNFINHETDYTAQDFARWINKSDTASLAKLPSFLSSQKAIQMNADKKTVLENMENLSLEILPVVNENEKFVGVVDRSRLTSSLIIDMANKLK